MDPERRMTDILRDCPSPLCACGFCDDEEAPERDCENPECGCGFCEEDTDG